VDTAGRTARRGGRRIELTAREYALLEILALRRATPVSCAELGGLLGHGGDPLDANAVEVLVSRLRRKLDPPGRPTVLQTRRGFGYLLAAAP